MLGRVWFALAILGALVCLPMIGCSHGNRRTSLDRSLGEVRIVKQYWPDGRLRLRKQVSEQSDGTLVNHGTYARWYDNGRKEFEATFIQGRNHGRATRWHRNGQKSVEEHYVYGKRHGTRRTWDENGVKRKEEHHVDDEPDGIWTVWDKHGRIKWQGRFDHGIPES